MYKESLTTSEILVKFPSTRWFNQIPFPKVLFYITDTQKFNMFVNFDVLFL